MKKKLARTIFLIALGAHIGVASARYVQPDPIGLDAGLNRFTYVNGNPLMFTDPMGLMGQGSGAGGGKPVWGKGGPLKTCACSSSNDGSSAPLTPGGALGGSMLGLAGTGAVAGLGIGLAGTGAEVAGAVGLVGHAAAMSAAGHSAITGTLIGGAAGAVVGTVIAGAIILNAPPSPPSSCPAVCPCPR